MAVIRGTPLQDGSTMYVHARTKFTQIYAVDVVTDYDTEHVANSFIEFTEQNEFVKQVCEKNGVVCNTPLSIREQLKQFRILKDFDIAPVTIPNLILVFGIHTELCVTDHIEYLRQRFPNAQILILDDLCANKSAHGEYFLFNYCLRVKHADVVSTNNLIILNEDS